MKFSSIVGRSGSGFSPAILLADAIAGLSVAFILLPEAVAYAAIAHLSIQAAIAAAVVGLLCYACLGKSPFAIVAPTSSAAALLAAVVLSLHPLDADAAIGFGSALVILTGAGLLVVAKAGLGRLSAFVSRPVLHGFSFALAVTIIIKQLPILFGIDVAATSPLPIIIELIHHYQEWSAWSTGIGIGALLILWLLKRWPIVPGAFVILVAGIGLSAWLNLAALQVDIVGPLHIKPPAFVFPELPLEKWLRLAELAFGLLVIIVAESWGSIRSLSLNHGNSVEPNRELLALGAANLLSGLLQGMPVGAGFSASSANEAAGAQTKLAGVAAGVVLLLMTLFGQKWIGLIPEPLVAAAVINALSHALNPKSLLALWRINRDQYLALAAVLAVLAFGVLHGMLIAIALSLMAAIRAFSQPVVRELAKLDDTTDYVDRDNHPSAVVHDRLLILRPEEPLFFASVEGILAEINHRLQLSSDVRTLIISLEVSANLDSTAAECLIEFTQQLEQQNKTLVLARVKDPISSLLLQLAHDKFAGKLFWSVNDAVLGAKKLEEMALL
ncbi:SulP family inorganic anion transporter [Methylomonas paludis]|uniref:SulP family inorganic anion transporter n=1 Tax=Methylomonas paludis TaxID=1173101 RepID=A0A975RA31_9GAMM|nr:SulP family inorganic anion transporter [Methylomonas paludis]QWF70908.1 SulP family inorganic anion transporter [Methylomonas paludis]